MNTKPILLFSLFLFLANVSNAQKVKWFYHLEINASKSIFRQAAFHPSFTPPKSKTGISFSYGGGIEMKFSKRIYLRTGIKTTNFREYDEGSHPFFELNNSMMFSIVELPFKTRTEINYLSIPAAFLFRSGKMTFNLGIQASALLKTKQTVDVETNREFLNSVNSFSIFDPHSESKVNTMEPIDLSLIFGFSYYINSSFNIYLITNVSMAQNLIFHPAKQDFLHSRNQQISLGISHFL